MRDLGAKPRRRYAFQLSLQYLSLRVHPSQDCDMRGLLWQR